MIQLRLHFAVQGINVFFNFLASFIIGQFFNTMLCSMQVAPQATVLKYAGLLYY